MIKRVVASVLLGCLVIALFLKLAGVAYPVRLAPEFLGYIQRLNIRANEIVFTIPEIPHIPVFNNGFLDFFVGVGNFFVDLINVLSGLINAIVVFVTACVIAYQETHGFINGGFAPFRV